MPILKIDRFRGLIPKVADRNTPTGFARTAENVRFDAGDLSPLLGPINSVAFSGQIGNLFYLRDDQTGDPAKFIAFGENHKVDFLRGPTPDDEHHRFYWNIAGEHFRAISNPLGTPTPNGGIYNTWTSNYQQFQGYRVGIPAPTKAPLVEDGTPEQVLDYGAVTNISRVGPITVTATSEIPFAKGTRVKFVIQPDLPRGEEQPTEEVPEGDVPAEEGPAVGRLWELSGLEGTVANIGASGPNTFDIIGVSGSEIGTEDLTAEEQAAIRLERVLSDSELESRLYVFTYVSEFGEEGPPSPPSEIIDVPSIGGIVNLTIEDSPWLAEQGGDRRYIEKARLYRQVSGSQSGVFLFAGEVNMTTPNMEGTWSEQVSDEADPVDLGEPLPSARWYPPPTGLEGVHLMPNGFMVGFKGNALYFSEPYLPHAWNPDYKKTVDNDILGIESFGNTLVIGTRGRPYLATGTDPASVSVRKLASFAPLEKPRAMVDAGIGVLYPSTVGMMLIGQSGIRNITEQTFDKRTWQSFLGALDRGIFHDDRAIFFAPGEDPLVIDMNGDSADISRLTGAQYDISAACIYEDDLAMVRKNGGWYSLVQIFKTGATNQAFLWESGLVSAPYAMNVAAGQVFASGYPVTVRLSHANLTQDGQPDYDNMVERTYTVEGPEPFRLESDYLSREFRIAVESMHRVQEVVFSTSMGELKRV